MRCGDSRNSAEVRLEASSLAPAPLYGLGLRAPNSGSGLTSVLIGGGTGDFPRRLCDAAVRSSGRSELARGDVFGGLTSIISGS